MSSRPESRRIVVTGMGVVSPLGCTLAEFHEGLRRGASGIGTIDVPWPTGYPVERAGVVTAYGSPRFRDGEPPPAPGRALRFARQASRSALAQAGLDPASGRVAVIVGTTWGEALELEQSLLVPGAPPREPLSGMSERLRCELGAEGPCCVVTTTCAAGNHAIAIGCDLLRGGCADAALAVGTDALSYTVLLGFSRLLLRDPQTCRPFDLHRNGTVLSEGAGALLLERAPSALRRGAAILGEVAGCGLSCDAAGPFESRAANLASLEVAADAAFRDAGFGPEVIDHVSAHGSATRLNDVKETNFLKRLLGPRAYAVPVSGIKSMLGHAQGAASSLEAIACLLTLRHDVLYPTINLCTPDPDCDLDYVPGAARAARVNAILSNAFGMGGTNALCIFRRWDEP